MSKIEELLDMSDPITKQNYYTPCYNQYGLNK